jgi:hypothetical protein
MRRFLFLALPAVLLAAFAVSGCQKKAADGATQAPAADSTSHSALPTGAAAIDSAKSKAAAASAASGQAAAAIKTYTCTMDPDVITHEPGRCPKCGMELVLKK